MDGAKEVRSGERVDEKFHIDLKQLNVALNPRQLAPSCLGGLLNVSYEVVLESELNNSWIGPYKELSVRLPIVLYPREPHYDIDTRPPRYTKATHVLPVSNLPVIPADLGAVPVDLTDSRYINYTFALAEEFEPPHVKERKQMEATYKSLYGDRGGKNGYRRASEGDGWFCCAFDDI